MKIVELITDIIFDTGSVVIIIMLIIALIKIINLFSNIA